LFYPDGIPMGHHRTDRPPAVHCVGQCAIWRLRHQGSFCSRWRQDHRHRGAVPGWSHLTAFPGPPEGLARPRPAQMGTSRAARLNPGPLDPQARSCPGSARRRNGRLGSSPCRGHFEHGREPEHGVPSGTGRFGFSRKRPRRSTRPSASQHPCGAADRLLAAVLPPARLRRGLGRDAPSPQREAHTAEKAEVSPAIAAIVQPNQRRPERSVMSDSWTAQGSPSMTVDAVRASEDQDQLMPDNPGSAPAFGDTADDPAGGAKSQLRDREH
jgi:hypothetical protein